MVAGFRDRAHLKQNRDIRHPPALTGISFADPDTLSTNFYPACAILGRHMLLLTFDEFDTLDRPKYPGNPCPTPDHLFRRLIEVDGLNFIFSIGSSGDKLENMQAAYTDFFKSALYRKISFLTKGDCLA